MQSVQTPIQYRVRAHRPEAHLFELTCTVPAPDPRGQIFRLPVWIPGSYMIREFARNIVSLRAMSGDMSLAVEKLDKHSWRVHGGVADQPMTLSYEVYAWDLSVRAAHLDVSHGFFNGSSVFLAVEGQTGSPCVVDIERPEGAAYRDWQVVTSLPRVPRGVGAARPYGFGLYQANSYDELIDHPVEMGRFTLVHFHAAGVRHDVAVTGRHDCDTERLVADLQRVCEWQIALFGGPAPVDYYAFLVMVVGDGYGGLEHRASTALIASRGDLPWRGMQGMPDGYKAFLGLCSHEYFHTWNVKRIKPAAFSPYDLSCENYTRLLWAFEGFTSYYDDLALVRSGVIALEDYLGLLGKTISNVLRTPGRLRQSVAESSFDAWIKYYRQDENSPNAIVSYYAKGALIALALDLQMRSATESRLSLDDVMRFLWQRYGQTGLGVPEDGIFLAVAEVATMGGERTLGGRLSRWLRKAVEGTEDLPLERWLKSFGINWRVDAVGKATTLGAKVAATGAEVKLVNVFDDGPAQRAGLSAGDVLVAMDGLRVTGAGLDGLLARRKPGERVEVHAFRRDELMRFDVELGEPEADTVTLGLVGKPTALAAMRRRGWLGG